MALLIQKIPRKNVVLGIWKIEEERSWYFNNPQLTKRVQNRIGSYRSVQRKLQGIAVRILINELLPDEPNIDIDYDDNNKPYFISTSHKLSISHSKDMVAVLISKQGEVGVDVEGWSPKVQRISQKFMNDDELKMLEDLGESERILYLHVLWGAKESMFKLYGKGSLSFKNNLLVSQFVLKEEGQFVGVIKKGEKHIEVDGFYSNVGKFVLVYVLESQSG